LACLPADVLLLPLAVLNSLLNDLLVQEAVLNSLQQNAPEPHPQFKQWRSSHAQKMHRTSQQIVTDVTFCRQACQLLESVWGVKVFRLSHTSTADGTSKRRYMAVARESWSSSFFRAV